VPIEIGPDRLPVVGAPAGESVEEEPSAEASSASEPSAEAAAPDRGGDEGDRELVQLKPSSSE
jgi:hypothetical protein